MTSSGGLQLPPADAWRAALQQLEFQFDRATFDTWVRGAVLLRVEPANGADVFVIGVKNTYARDMLQTRLYRNLWRVLADVCGRSIELRFEIHRAAATPTAHDDMPLFRVLRDDETSIAPVPAIADETGAAGGTTAPRPPLHQRIARPKRADLPESVLNPRFTLTRFVAGLENAFVYNAARSVFERPDETYNPLFIYGGSGTGKTHLLQAIAHECIGRGMKALYISSEAFTNDLIEALRERRMAMFRERYRTVDVLLVDDIQFIAGKEATQEEFFHTFNTLHAFNKQVVLASDRHPRELTTLEDRLRSRFGSGLISDLQPPGFETRLAILRNWSLEKGVSLPREVLHLLAGRAQASVRELEGIFIQIIAHAQLNHAPIDETAALGILDGFHRPRQHGITVQRVLETVAKQFHLHPTDLIGPRRTERINQARQIAMYLARELTTASLPQIGDAFGGRKHSTVAHACKQVTQQAACDRELTAILKDVRVQLTGE